MTIDDKVKNEISCAYAGKNIAGYLHVTAPEAPPEWKRMTRWWAIEDAIFGTVEKLHSAYLFVFDRQGYNDKKKSIDQEKQTRKKLWEFVRADEEAETERLRASGIISEQEKDAYTVAFNAGIAIKCFIYFTAKEKNENEEIIESKNKKAKEISVTPEVLENCLKISVKEGIACLEEKYWINISGVKKPEIINPDFEIKATEWLKNNIYSRTENLKECRFLETVLVKREKDGNFNLSLFNEKNNDND